MKKKQSVHIISKASLENIQKVFDSLGYKFFTNKDYNLNIFGIRNDNRKAGYFDDRICCYYKEKGLWKLREWVATTDPGQYYLEHPLNSEGTAILAPGQYRSVYKIGLHKGEYKALVQSKPLTVYRDNNKDDILDFKASTKQKGIFGINIHRSSLRESTMVGKWSAGCQVFKKGNDFNNFMKICDIASRIWDNSFTYTLLTENQINSSLTE